MDQNSASNLDQLYQALGYTFHDPQLLHRALSHSSYVHENPDQGQESNERLEFLGDAVLELCITQLLYQRFPAASEGQLSKARSGVVNESRLATLALSLDLGQYLLLGRGEILQGGFEKPSILADAMEAVFAAIYLDGGLSAADDVVRHLLGPATERALKRAPRRDHKTRLQERVQEYIHITPRYSLLSAEGPDHAKVFTVALYIDNQVVAQGIGRSKKEAEQDAAGKALDLWDQDLHTW